MGQIEVLIDLGEPYVRLEDYRAAIARVEAAEAEAKRFENAFNAQGPMLYKRIDELEAQLDAAGWRVVGEPPAGDKGVDVIVSLPAFYVPTEWGGGWTIEYPDDESPEGSYSLLIDGLIIAWRPAPPDASQEPD